MLDSGLPKPAAPAAVGHPKLVDKSAQTRFNNDRVAAKKQGLQGMAANAMKMKQQPQGLKRDFATTLPSFKKNPVQQMNQAVEPPSDFLPMENEMPQQMIDPQMEFQAQLDLNDLFDSAEFKDSMTKVHLTNYFKGQHDDPETFGLKALANLVPKQ